MFNVIMDQKLNSPNAKKPPNAHVFKAVKCLAHKTQDISEKQLM